MKLIDSAYRTLFSELEQRCLDAEFDEAYPESGAFKVTTVKGRGYWYFVQRIDGKPRKRYVGPAADPEIDRRVKAFKAIKDDYRARRRLVSTLVNEAGLPRPPDPLTGDLVEAFWKAGLFRLRCVIVGSVAFSCYPGLVGVRLPMAPMSTGDIDFAQFYSISISVGDSIPPVLDILRAVDPSFRDIPHQTDGRATTQFINDRRFKVEFLAPNASKDEYLGRPAPMPALGGASATTLRFLDFLIADPVRAVMLHKGGIPVRVPAPERYAVHKLIVATRRRVDGGDATISKRDKDILQAGALIEVLTETRKAVDLADVWAEAWYRGPAWREALLGGRSLLAAEPRTRLDEALVVGLRELGLEPDAFTQLPGHPASKPKLGS